MKKKDLGKWLSKENQKSDYPNRTRKVIKKTEQGK
jgi:hypothetical protein